MFWHDAGFRPLYKVLQRDMNSRETLFAGLAGLRGSVSLILAQAVVTEDEGGDSDSQVSLCWATFSLPKHSLLCLSQAHAVSPLL